MMSIIVLNKLLVAAPGDLGNKFQETNRVRKSESSILSCDDHLPKTRGADLISPIEYGVRRVWRVWSPSGEQPPMYCRPCAHVHIHRSMDGTLH